MSALHIVQLALCLTLPLGLVIALLIACHRARDQL